MPYKDKTKRQESQRNYVDRVRQGIDKTPKGIDKTDNLSNPKEDNLSNPLDHISSVFKTASGRQKLLDILAAFEDSHHPEYMEDVRLGYYGHSLHAIKAMSR